MTAETQLGGDVSWMALESCSVEHDQAPGPAYSVQTVDLGWLPALSATAASGLLVVALSDMAARAAMHYFDAQFAYESLALPILVFVLFALARRVDTGSNQKVGLAAVLVLAVGVVVTTLSRGGDPHAVAYRHVTYWVRS
jgi:hypothetical protein